MRQGEGMKRIRRGLPGGRARTLRFLGAALLASPLSACLPTPGGFLVPPVPVVKVEREYRAYRILGRDHDADGVETALATYCLLPAHSTKQLRERWKGDWEVHPYGGAEFNCLSGHPVAWYVRFRRQGTEWQLLTPEPTSGPVGEFPEARPGQSAYIVCLSTGSGVMSLNKRLNQAEPVETRVQWCRDYDGS